MWLLEMSYEALIVLVEVALLIVMPVAAEVGFRAGLRRHRPNEDQDEALGSQVGIVQATTFAILGLLAAFTISMAEGRFSARRALILDEANAIGTTFLRSKYLREPHPAELAPLFRSYVDARVAYYAAGGDVTAAERELVTAERLQREIWAHAIEVVREDPEHGDSISAFVESLNEMIDLENARVAAITTHVPLTVIVLVVLVGLLACVTTGYDCGLAGRRVWLSVLLLPLLVGVAICVMIDLDAPRIGLITTGQPPMLRLQQSLAADAGGAEADPR